VDVLLHDPRRGAYVEVHYATPGVPMSVSMDPEQMRQVWLNLAVNALEAVGASGRIDIRWQVLDGGFVGVEFIDSGAGIAAEDLSRVGEPFFTTKRGGTGLGLAIAQRIVERHGGVLILESEPGHGTTARVQLPVRVEAMAEVA
jgi:signal transduction histidine kinase